MGFITRETMSGTHEFQPGYGPAGRLGFEFQVEWGPERTRDWLNPTHPGFLWQELHGRIKIEGLCDWTPVEGTLHLQYFRAHRIQYRFDFSTGGVDYSFVGNKENIRLWNLPVSHTTCFGVLTDRSTGELVSTSTSFFRMRDLPSLLRVRKR